MAKWYEEAAFKSVAGGYVFQPPTLFWPVVRSRGYLVNEAQKAELIACLRRQRRRIFFLLIVYVLICVGLTTAVGMSGALPRISPADFIAKVTAMALVVVPILIVLHLYLVRGLRPLIADLPRTDERITVGDTLHSVAAAIPGPLLPLGGIVFGVVIIGNIVAIVDAIAEDRGGPSLALPIFGLLFGALMTSYSAYLAVLKAKLKRTAD
jgi:hypothetical protein